MHQRLITRVGGFKFLIHSNGSFATGMFVAEKADGTRTTFMDLPYELRSTYESIGGQIHVLLAAAADAVDTLQRKVEYATGMHQVGLCSCENCRISDVLYYRQNLRLRGNVHSFNRRMIDCGSKRRG